MTVRPGQAGPARAGPFATRTRRVTRTRLANANDIVRASRSLSQNVVGSFVFDLESGEDRGEEKNSRPDRVGGSWVGPAQTSVQRAQSPGDIFAAARFVHPSPLSALRRAGRGFGFISSVRAAVEGSCRILREGPQVRSVECTQALLRLMNDRRVLFLT